MNIEEAIKGRYRNDYHKGLINLIYTVNQLNYDFMRHLKKHKLTEPQYNILRVLRGFREQGPCSLGFIKERMLDKSSDVSRIVDKLYAKGLVTRCESTADRRRKAIEISVKGLTLLEAMGDTDTKADSLLSNLTPEEVATLNKLLDKIRVKP